MSDGISVSVGCSGSTGLPAVGRSQLVSPDSVW